MIIPKGAIYRLVITIVMLLNISSAMNAQQVLKGKIPTATRIAEMNLLRELLSLPNDAQYPQDIDRNISWLQTALSSRGFTVNLLPSAARPFIFAEKKIDALKPTVLFYMHFDGQPVTAADWKQESPFMPVLKEKRDTGWTILDWKNIESGYSADWRIFARSASDDKGPIAMFLAGMDRLAKERITPAFNIKLILDSEEEKGSPHLPGLVKQYAALLRAERLVILDGPRHTSNEPTLLFGCRGVAQLDLQVYGPRNDLHSGHYGNYSPNPAYELAALLASMKDRNGQVIVPGFYKGIQLSRSVRDELKKVPDDKKYINQQIGIAREINAALTYQEGLQSPSLNILNMSSGKPEIGTRNIVPATAAASLDIRLVPESDPVHIESVLKAFISNKGYHIIPKRAPTEEERNKYPRIISFDFSVASLAFVTEPNSASGIWLSKCVKGVFGKEPVKIRMAGGTVPIAPFIKELNIPAVLIPMVNPDNSQHASNENLRLGNYFEGIDVVCEVLTTGF